MRSSPERVEPAVEVWNRATSGVPWSELAGDVALAHALRLDGYAAAGSVLSGLEMEIGEDWVGQGRAGFAWFGLDPVVAVLDTARQAYEAMDDSGLEGEAQAARYEEIDRWVSTRYDELDVTSQLAAALRHALAERPGEFGATTGSVVDPRSVEPGAPDPLDADPVQRLLTGAAGAGRAGAARAVPADEKLRRCAQALVAFGFDAEVEDGLLALRPWPDEDDELLQAVLALLDLRYPDA